MKNSPAGGSRIRPMSKLWKISHYEDHGYNTLVLGYQPYENYVSRMEELKFILLGCGIRTAEDWLGLDFAPCFEETIVQILTALEI